MEPLKMILTRLNALQYTKVMVVLTPFCGTVCTILLSSAIFMGGSGALKAQMPVVSLTTGICRVYAVYFAAKISRIRFAASEGVLPTFTPAASRASFFA